MNDKKRKELAYLNAFLKNNQFEFDVISIEPSETPDFVLHTSIGLISVEITQLIMPELKVIEVFRNSVVNKAHQLFRDQYKQDTYSLVTLRNIALGDRVQRQSLITKYAQKLFERAERIYLSADQQEFDVTEEHINEHDDIITRLHVKSSPGFDHWQHFGAHRVDGIDAAWLNKRIAEKEGRIDSYRKFYDQKWLLLISNMGTKPSAHRFDFLDFSNFTSRFARVYSYNSNAAKTIILV